MNLKIDKAIIISNESCKEIVDLGQKLKDFDAAEFMLPTLEGGSYGLVNAISIVSYGLHIANLENKDYKIIPVENAQEIYALSKMLVSRLQRFDKNRVSGRYKTDIIKNVDGMLLSAEKFNSIIVREFQDKKIVRFDNNTLKATSEIFDCAKMKEWPKISTLRRKREIIAEKI